MTHNPVRREERIAFGIKWFATEAEADAYAADVVKEGVTYNGGWLHGMPCGRDKTWDVKDTNGNTIEFAVTD